MDGIIVINKPKNCTSHDIVYKVKKIAAKKVGHTGTLDPNATGVLPLLIGKGTLLSKYLINHDKTYEVVLKLGVKTDSADAEGKVIEKNKVKEELLEEDIIKENFKKFLGKQEQIPPIYSAIKVNGKKLYEYARKGQEVQIKPRQIEIYNIELLNINKEESEIAFKVSCSKGTYIRSLCEDIASKIGTIGYMKELKRTQVGQFDIKEAITVEEFENNYANQEFLNNHIISIENVFKNNDSLILKDKDLLKFLNGVKLKYDLKDGIYRIYNTKEIFIGTGVIDNRTMKRDIII